MSFIYKFEKILGIREKEKDEQPGNMKRPSVNLKGCRKTIFPDKEKRRIGRGTIAAHAKRNSNPRNPIQSNLST